MNVRSKIYAAYESVPDALLIVGRDGSIVFANQHAERLFGYEPGQLVGVEIEALIPERDRQRHAEVRAEFSVDPAVRPMGFGRELFALRSDGREFPVEVGIGPADRDANTVAVVRDITSLAKIRGSLHEAKTEANDLSHAFDRKLRHAERLASIGTFAAGIAHQINNPVGGILLAAQYAATARDDPAAIDGALEDIVADARRCGQIVRHLLRFAQEDTTDKAPRELNGFVRSCATNLSRRIEETGAEIELSLDPGLPPVSLNETAMGEVLFNLLQNSVEAGAKHIVLRTRAGQASARLVVEDDGQGVTSEDKHHAFDPFFTTRQGRGGTGLGLSIGHGIVADHGGTIELESEPGHGTTVTIELPRAGNEGGQDTHR